MGAAFNLDNRMTVVLFAGMGGGCDGLEQAGFHVHVAINHDPVAVAVHERRHPHTRHLRCDVFEADPRAVCGTRGVRILHASPDCTHFSVAKGSKPVSKRRRSLAWVICRWAGTVRPEIITLENVSEIMSWGPLIAKRDPATGRVLRLDGTVAAKGERVPVQDQWLVPDPRHKGRIWRAWERHMRGLRFSFESRVLVCADYGVPTIRKRLFGVAKADGSPAAWPVRTHAPRKDAKRLGLKPWIGAHTIIDWSLPVRSIFERSKPLADATLRRIARGVMRHVVEAGKPFIAPITHSGTDRVHSLAEPLRTLTTAHRGELSVVVPHLQMMRNSDVPYAAANEPVRTLTAGGANPYMVATFLAQHNSGPRAGMNVRGAQEPVSALTTTGAQQGVVACSLLSLYGTNTHGRAAREPVATITAGGCHAGVVAATLADMRGRSPGGRDAEEPLSAVTAKPHGHLILGFLQHYFGSGKQDDDVRAPLGALTGKARYGLVEVTVGGKAMVIADIGSRMLEPEEGAAAHGFPPGALPSEITIDGVTRPLTKTQKYHLVGNSVPPRMIRLLAECNARAAFAEAAE